LALTIYFLSRKKETKRKLDALKLKLPLFGDIWKKSVLARTFRTFAALVQAGVPILSALEMTADVSGNAVVEDAFAQLAEKAKRGASLGETAKKIKVVPPLAAYMITIGEQTGRLEDMVDKVADWFEFELDEKIKRLTSILEPVLIVFVGGVVALVVFAVFMPIIGSIQGLLNGI
jgi:type IV pilus assembly protein PilC